MRGLGAIEDKIRDTYQKEKALDVLETTLPLDGKELQVRIKYCPAVKHLKDTGREVSPWYRYTTEVVMETLASLAGLHFKVHYYNEETGETQYGFVSCKQWR